ncbi:MAG: hypothetical protein P1U89_07580 [Verrucomicrobiales bacterium]|nr:hypothetical protein [Verrucomicrobiales bacterium]
MKNSISKVIVACAVIGVGLFASNAQAQHYYPDSGYNAYGYNGGGNLGQSVFTIDQYGDQMSHIYGIEARNYCGCPHTTALLNEMRRYNIYTTNLMNAYRGTCPVAFKNAACGVHSSYHRIQTLRTRARVSPQVCGLISHSSPLVNYVHSNYSSFRPVQAPVPYQVYPRSSCATPVPHYSHHRHHSRSRHGKIDVGSAIFGAVAGRVLHGVIHGH